MKSTKRFPGVHVPPPPVAEQRSTRHVEHGEVRLDDYHWLRDERWQEVMRDPSVLDSSIRDYLEAENEYMEAVLGDTRSFEGRLFEEMKARIKEDDSSVPLPDGEYSYFYRYEEGGQHPIYCRVPRSGDAELAYLDVNDLARDHNYCKVSACVHSPDHRYAAFTVDFNGSEYYELRILEIATGRVLPDRVEQVQAGAVWANDSQQLLYVVLDEQHRPCKVLCHTLGEETSLDTLVYEEEDPGFFLGVGACESRRYILVQSYNHITSEVRLLDANSPRAVPRLLATRQEHVRYTVTHHGDWLWILTNADEAKDFKLMRAPLESTSRDEWVAVLPEEPGRLLLELHVFSNHLVRLERVGGLPRIVITRLSDREEHVVAFQEEAYDLDVSPGYEFDTSTLRYTYSSMTTPLRVFDYDMESRSRVLRKEQEIPSGHSPDDYITRRLFAQGHDGSEVPVSILMHRDTPLDGSAPLLLYGYGSYGMSMPASFSSPRLSLVDRGFVYAIAHIRGGKEKGFRWYEDGKLFNKRNTFLDFIASAEHLIDTGYTSAGRIAAMGGSAGGMLMGAVANMRSDLFSALVAQVPFVDVLTTICDASLPLTPPEWPEWGNPIEDRKAYDYIGSYSPYDNVERKGYPHIFVTAGLTDPRVTYWEPAKWVARLRAYKTDDNALLLWTHMDAGHGGASGRFERLRETARAYVFVLCASGLLDVGDKGETP